MSSTDSIEATAATVEAAIRQALAELGAQEDDVTIEVLATPRAGVLGLGARQARVRVTRRAPEGARSGVTSPPPAPPLRPPARDIAPKAPPPPVERASSSDARPPVRPEPRAREAERRPVVETELSHQTASADNVEEERESAAEAGGDLRRTVPAGELVTEAGELLRQILGLMGERAEIEIGGDQEQVELVIKGDGSGILIGRHGQTLDALEYLVNRMLARKIKDAPPISIDTESYRARRRQQLHRMALSKGEQAKREHVAVLLDPMPPRDRRIIHLALKDDPLITTRSSGDGFLRSIQIVPVNERRDGGPEGRERGRERERPRGREKSRERTTPVGEQGGFKHGQKRIV